MTTPEQRQELLRLAEKAYHGTYSWEFFAAGLKPNHDTAKYEAAAANLAPDLAREVEQLSGKVGELEAELRAWANRENSRY